MGLPEVALPSSLPIQHLHPVHWPGNTSEPSPSPDVPCHMCPMLQAVSEGWRREDTCWCTGAVTQRVGRPRCGHWPLAPTPVHAGPKVVTKLRCLLDSCPNNGSSFYVS